MSRALTGLTILITRPKGQADGIINACHEQGAAIIHEPMFEITEPDSYDSIQSASQLLPQADWAIFTSTNAVAYALDFVEEWPSRVRVTAIGPKTAEMLIDNGVEVTAMPEKDYRTEGLLELPELQSIEGQTAIIFTGQNPRQTLEAQLSERGANVCVAHAYQRRYITKANPALLKQLQASKIDVSLITSGETLNQLVSLYLKSAKISDIGVFIVASKRIAALAASLGVPEPSIVVASSATDEAMLQALIKWRSIHE